MPHTPPGKAAEELLGAAEQGSEEAWTEIVTSLQDELLRYAERRGVADPEDVVQEAFCAAVQQVGRIYGGWEGLRAWLYTVVARRCADRRRRHSRSETIPVERVDLEDPDSAADLALWEAAEETEAAQALGVLSERERLVVVLRVVCEYSTAEVAEMVGVTPINVRVIQSRALGKLRRHLECGGGVLDRRFRHTLPPIVAAVGEKLRRWRHTQIPAGVADAGEKIGTKLTQVGQLTAAVALAGGISVGVAIGSHDAKAADPIREEAAPVHAAQEAAGEAPADDTPTDAQVVIAEVEKRKRGVADPGNADAPRVDEKPEDEGEDQRDNTDEVSERDTSTRPGADGEIDGSQASGSQSPAGAETTEADASQSQAASPGSGGVAGTVGEVVGGAVEETVDVVETAVGGVAETVEEAVDVVETAVSGVAETAGGVLEGVASGNVDVGGTVGDVVETVSSTVDEGGGVVEEVAGTVEGTVTESVGLVGGLVGGVGDLLP